MINKTITAVVLLTFFGFIAFGWSIFLLADENKLSTIQPVSRKDLIRFHVVANSDSQFDQEIKIKVRDAVLDYLAPLLNEASTAVSAKEILLSNRENVVRIADTVLAEQGTMYRTNMEIGTFEFPVKLYGTVSVPAGQYEAVRLLLGEASGKNWWCVLFPPLCFIDINSTIAAQPVSAAANTDEAARKKQIEFKWKLAEILSK